jgi:hypothetical protein
MTGAAAQIDAAAAAAREPGGASTSPRDADLAGGASFPAAAAIEVVHSGAHAAGAAQCLAARADTAASAACAAGGAGAAAGAAMEVAAGGVHTPGATEGLTGRAGAGPVGAGGSRPAGATASAAVAVVSLQVHAALATGDLAGRTGRARRGVDPRIRGGTVQRAGVCRRGHGHYPAAKALGLGAAEGRTHRHPHAALGPLVGHLAKQLGLVGLAGNDELFTSAPNRRRVQEARLETWGYQV